MKRIKIGFIGAGARGRGSALRMALLKEEFQICAAADPHAESIREFNKLNLSGNIKTYENYRDLLKRADIEAVVVSTPNYLHCEQALAVLQARKHLLLEKPMALSLSDCREIIRAAAKNKCVLQLGMEMHYHKLVREIKMKIEKGLIGDIRMIWFEEFRQPFLKKVGDWIIQKKFSGGTFVEKNCHHFDLFNWFAQSRPVRVYAAGSHAVAHKKDGGIWKKLKSSGAKQDVIDHGFVIVEYANGVKASLTLSMFSPGLKERMGIIGERGSFDGDLGGFRYIQNRISIGGVKTDLCKLSRQGIEKKFGHGGSEYGQYVSFYKSIRHGKPVEVDGRAGMLAVAVGLAAEKSAEQHRAIAISEIK